LPYKNALAKRLNVLHHSTVFSRSTRLANLLQTQLLSYTVEALLVEESLEKFS